MLREASGSPVSGMFLEPGSKSGCTTQSLMAELLCGGLLVRIKDRKPSPAGVFPDGLEGAILQTWGSSCTTRVLEAFVE